MTALQAKIIRFCLWIACCAAAPLLLPLGKPAAVTAVVLAVVLALRELVGIIRIAIGMAAQRTEEVLRGTRAEASSGGLFAHAVFNLMMFAIAAALLGIINVIQKPHADGNEATFILGNLRGLGVLFVFFTLMSLPALAISGRQALRFERRGLVLDKKRRSCCIPWDSIATAEKINLGDDEVLRLHIPDPRRLEVSPPESRLSRFLSQRRRGGGDIDLVPSTYGLDTATLVRGIQQYMRDPSARGQLPRTGLS